VRNQEKKYPWDKHADGSPRDPQDDLAAAEKLINQCGYHRRDEELDDARKPFSVCSQIMESLSA
jgi:hypothetical protein